MITQQQITQILAKALPLLDVRSFELLTGGVRNLNYLLHVNGSDDPLVLRIYTRDPAACQKEIDLDRLISGRIPVAEIVYADTAGDGDIGPHTLKRYVDGDLS